MRFGLFGKKRTEPQVPAAADPPGVEGPPADPIDPALLDEVSGSGLFDAEWYAHRYADIRDFPNGPLGHFCRHGMAERRDPGPNFSTRNYLLRCPEAAASDVPPFLHALRNTAERREDLWRADDDETLEYLLDRSGLFDRDWYLDRYRDVARSGLPAIGHFIRYGAAEFRNPGPGFDTESYTERYPDYRDTARSPIEHYLRIGRHLGHATKGPPPYEVWIEAFDELTPADLDRIREAEAGTSLPPTVLLHVIDADAFGHLDAILAAWEGQIGAEWSGRLVRGNGLSDAQWAECVARCGTDRRLSALPGSDALRDIPDGSIVLLCGAASLLRPHAAYVFGAALGRSGLEAAYCDHDRIGPEGVRSRPVFKPAMSPEFMRRLAYPGPVAAFIVGAGRRHPIADALARAAAGDPAASWAGLLLGIDADRVLRVPFVLFHAVGREPDEEDASLEPVPEAPPAAADAGQELQFGEDLPFVQILIPTRDLSELLGECIESIVALTDYPRSRFGITVIDNGSSEDATFALLDRLRETAGVGVVASPGPFNFARICNDGAAAVEADILVFLNNDTTVNRGDWLGKLVAQARRPDIGAVGPQLLYPDNTVQHGGLVLGVEGVGGHRLVGVEAEAASRTDVTREMVAVTGACLAIRRALFWQLGGFDPVLRVAFNDVQLCASAHEAGHRNIYLAEPLLFHHESKSRGFDDSRQKIHRNAREAIHVRTRFPALFQNDPSYSPNLSLHAIGALAYPPRVVRPWRRPPDGRRRVLLLSTAHGLGHGVATVVAQQASFLRDRGWEVIVGGPQNPFEITYEGCRRVELPNVKAAAIFAVNEGVDCVIVHTPPFFSLVRLLGPRPLLYFMDHGEPTPSLFPSPASRQKTDWEKRFCAPLAARVFTISRAVYRQQFRSDAIVLRNGNSHLASWSEEWSGRRPQIRERLGFEGRFVVLNVCRFTEFERSYKGIDRYIDVASDFSFAYPHLHDRVLFVLAGRGDPEDVAYVQDAGLTTFANVTDEEMTELYAAGDLYMNLSQWEGYNLGIGQALAMGLDVVASDIDAHREFGVTVLDSTPELCAAVRDRCEGWRDGDGARRARIEPWSEPLSALAALIEADCARDAQERWF